MADKREDFDRTETMYERAIAAEPSYAFALSTFANFLADEREDWSDLDTTVNDGLDKEPW